MDYSAYERALDEAKIKHRDNKIAFGRASDLLSMFYHRSMIDSETKIFEDRIRRNFIALQEVCGLELSHEGVMNKMNYNPSMSVNRYRDYGACITVRDIMYLCAYFEIPAHVVMFEDIAGDIEYYKSQIYALRKHYRRLP